MNILKSDNSELRIRRDEGPSEVFRKSRIKKAIYWLYAIVVIFTVSVGTAEAKNVSSENAGITMAYYRNFFSGSMNHLIQMVEDKEQPYVEFTLENFQAIDWSERKYTKKLGRLYALQLYGYIVPPSNGTYTFYANANGKMKFYLSTDKREKKASPVEFLPVEKDKKKKAVKNDPEAFKYNKIGSKEFKLRAGKKYFVRVLFIPGWQDQLSIGWAKKKRGTSKAVIPKLITGTNLCVINTKRGNSK